MLKNFAKFTLKHLCQSFFFNKVAGLRLATLIKKTLPQVFSCEFCEIFKKIYFYRTPLVAAFVGVSAGEETDVGNTEDVTNWRLTANSFGKHVVEANLLEGYNSNQIK